MNILYEWLKEYVEVPAALPRFIEEMTRAGVSVEGHGPAPGGGGTLLELEITANRPDLSSHYGVAREAAALYSKPLKPIEPAPPEAAEPASGAAQVDIAAPELCHRYVALVFRNLKVGPSPDWLSRRLEACGLQSINNVVDATNYVLLELGHPTHAFDLDTLAERRIIVRTAKPGERIITLDGVTRELKPHHLVIADARRAVALAGIMGGAETEISLRTRNVLLESAWFDPITTRRAAKELGLRTEASYRFERGMDVEAPLRAARRCAELFLELAGGELLAGAIDVYPRPWQPPVLLLRASEIERVLGIPLRGEVVEGILHALGFQGARSAGDVWQVVAPSWRRDVTSEIDLIEELARLYGYDKFPSRLPPARQPVARPPEAEAAAVLRERLEAQGYDEAINFTPVNPAAAEKFLAPGDELARLRNPLSEEVSVLRPSGLVSLVEALAWNINRGQRNLRFYEIGKVYAMRGGGFRERRVLTLAATGLRREKSVGEAEQPFDFLALKGAVEAALEPFALPPLRFDACDATFLHPGERAAVSAGGQTLGLLGQLSPALVAAFKLRQPAYVAELDLEAVYAAGLRPPRYQPLSRFPAVARDFSLLLGHGISFSAVRQVIEELELPELVSMTAVDQWFRGGALPPDRYSLLIRVVFQSPEQTLTEEQIRRLSDRLVEALEKKLGARLRTQ
ncbi:MAG: phenylalanine--tRNA ligase subunit beta [Acidobacteria bacterium]|nr:phenylalanine--tRNA ligase subunit beta [Acidobacteriota bacterium]